MAKKMIIKGVGQLLAKRSKADGTGEELITMGSLQDLKIDMNVELEDIFGGDGLFAIDTLVKSKSIEITATDVKFDLAAMQIMMGSELEEQKLSSIWVLNEQHTLVPNFAVEGDTTSAAVAAIEVEFNTEIYGTGNFSVRLKDSNKLLTQVPFNAATAPGTGEFMVDAGGRVLLNPSYSGEIQVNYQREATVDMISILAEEVPFPVHIIHHGSFQQKDGSYQGIETELFQCRAKGTFSINAQRTTASASTLTLQVIDPERADGSLGSIKRYAATKRV